VTPVARQSSVCNSGAKIFFQSMTGGGTFTHVPPPATPLSMWFYISCVSFSSFLLVFFLTICIVLFYFSASCCVSVMAVLVTTLVLLLLINLDLDLLTYFLTRNFTLPETYLKVLTIVW